MTLLFELPFQNLRNIIFGKKATTLQLKEVLGKVTPRFSYFYSKIIVYFYNVFNIIKKNKPN